MDMMAVMQQIMRAPNKSQMFQNLLRQNPQYNQIWSEVQQLQNMDRQQVLNQIAKRNGTNPESLKQMARNFGINI